MKEILLMTGFSFIGMLFVPVEDWQQIDKLLYATVTIVFYVMAVFFLNSYAGYSGDAQSKRLKHVSKVPRNSYLLLTLFSTTVFCVFAFATSIQMLVVVVASILLWVAYYLKPTELKSILFGGTFAHLLGGILHFHMGYCAFEDIDLNSIKISLFFALILCTGHFNHEIMDAEDDRKNGHYTTTVRLGTHNALILRSSSAFLSLVCAAALLYTNSISTLTGMALISASGVMLISSKTKRFETLSFQKTTRAVFLVAGLVLIIEKLSQF